MISISSFRRSPPVLFILTLALMLGGCGEANPVASTSGGDAKSGEVKDGKRDGKGSKSGKGGGAAPVVVAPAQRKVVPLVIEAIGAVEPIRGTSVRSQVTGTLLKIAIQEGQDVRQGDLLFEIDPRPFRNALLSAEADTQRSKVQLETARAQVSRYEALTNMVSKEQQQRISDEARGLEASVAAAEAALANARLQLEYCSIRAPFAGRTGNLGVHEGDLVRANDSGDPLVTINQLSPIYVTFGVPQQHLAAIARYRAERALAVRVSPPGAEAEPELGELTFLDNMVDSATGTIRLKATLKNENHRLWPGQFATVGVTLAEPHVLTIGSSAVQTSQTGQHVYVISAERIAELRPVTIERTHEGLAVVTKGLKEGENVVIDGQLRVIPGRPVEIKPPAGSNPASGAKKNKKVTVGRASPHPPAQRPAARRALARRLAPRASRLAPSPR